MYLSAQTPFLILKSHLCSKHWNGTLGLVQNKLYVCHYHRKNLWHDQMLKCQGFNKQQKHLGACFRFIAFSLQICSKLKALPVNMSITNTRDIKRIQRITAWHGQDRGWGGTTKLYSGHNYMNSSCQSLKCFAKCERLFKKNWQIIVKLLPKDSDKILTDVIRSKNISGTQNSKLLKVKLIMPITKQIKQTKRSRKQSKSLFLTKNKYLGSLKGTAAWSLFVRGWLAKKGRIFSWKQFSDALLAILPVRFCIIHRYKKELLMWVTALL